ncbi:dethiobiotin synthase [Clostridiaceae bacterium M8S5]|nr:dethiobiotin synthase [Clostridiaceae bacterium M8S5]
MKHIFITGTDTDVGKTFVTAGITHILNKHNHKVCPYKPVQSGGIFYDNNLIAGDSKFVKDLTGIDIDYNTMNTYCLKTPVSPHRASEKEDVIIDPNHIISHFNHLKNTYEYVIVEGAGGAIVPIIRNSYYITDLIKSLGLSTLVVTRTSVGTINHTILTINYLKSLNIDVKGIVFNGYKGNDYEDDNIRVIKDITNIKNIFVLPHVESQDILDIKCTYEKYLPYNQITKLLDMEDNNE